MMSNTTLNEALKCKPSALVPWSAVGKTPEDMPALLAYKITRAHKWCSNNKDCAMHSHSQLRYSRMRM